MVVFCLRNGIKPMLYNLSIVIKYSTKISFTDNKDCFSYLREEELIPLKTPITESLLAEIEKDKDAGARLGIDVYHDIDALMFNDLFSNEVYELRKLYAEEKFKATMLSDYFRSFSIRFKINLTQNSIDNIIKILIHGDEDE